MACSNFNVVAGFRITEEDYWAFVPEFATLGVLQPLYDQFCALDLQMKQHHAENSARDAYSGNSPRSIVGETSPAFLI